MEKPEIYNLTRIRWQFFGTLTFRSAAVLERVRLNMWFAMVRRTVANLGLYFPNIPWCLRQEDGETNGRRHFHYLLGGFPERACTIASCFVQMAEWEKRGGGMARVRLFDQSLNGIDYIAPCLGMSGADVYESAKFGAKSSGLMLSKAAEAMLMRGIREERRFIERQEKTIGERKVSKAKSTVCLPPRNRRESAEFVARGELSSSPYGRDRRAWRENPYAHLDEIDSRGAGVKS